MASVQQPAFQHEARTGSLPPTLSPEAELELGAFLRKLSYSGTCRTHAPACGRAARWPRCFATRPVLLQPCRFFPAAQPAASAGAEESYVPMGPGAVAQRGPADYIPMSSGGSSSRWPELPADLEPPPVNRDLKPRRKRKPPQQACWAQGGEVPAATHAGQLPGGARAEGRDGDGVAGAGEPGGPRRWHGTESGRELSRRPCTRGLPATCIPGLLLGRRGAGRQH